MATRSGEKLIRTAEAAMLLDVEPRTLAAWRQRGVGPPVIRLTERTLRYRLRDVREYIAAHNRPAAAGAGDGTEAAE
jgi:phage terminase Nu1 subunit (DNA packaging protein)